MNSWSQKSGSITSLCRIQIITFSNDHFETHDCVHKNTIFNVPGNEPGWNSINLYQDIFTIIGKLELQVTRSYQHTLDCSHAVIIMRLAGQLFGTQSVRHHDLHCQVSSVEEAIRVQRDLSNQGVIRHHHRNCTEQHLNRISKLRKTGTRMLFSERGIWKVSRNYVS